LNIDVFSGLRSNAKESGRLLGESYAASSDYRVRYFNHPWRHSDFPRNVGVDPGFGDQLLSIVRR